MTLSAKYTTWIILLIVVGLMLCIMSLEKTPVAYPQFRRFKSYHVAVDHFSPTLHNVAVPMHRIFLNKKHNGIKEHVLLTKTSSDLNTGVLDWKKQMTSKTYKGIHILATGRSGSSFLGQILANSGRVFYMFEPGRLLDKYGNRPNIQNSYEQLHRYVNMITSMYHCRFENMEVYLNALMKLSYENQIDQIPELAGLGLDVCNTKKHAGRSHNGCSPITSELMTKICKNKEFIVIKTIRISDIMNLTQLVNDNEVDFKIIHLIRDPRGMILSKLKAWFIDVKTKMKVEHRHVFDVQDLSPGMYSALDHWCKVWIKDASIGQQMVSKYMTVRYEDISMMPLMSTREIYDKLGLGEVSEHVVNWLNEHTRESRGDEYSVSRNSKLNAEKWRRDMTYMLAKRIQELEKCGKFLDRFGYIKVKRPQDLTNASLSFSGKKYQHNEYN
ncbi:carbohydrate sulfotransferase 1-like [Anneissia japonica]|uniref:carbohydrate sulfotransferase 1-like n=1 Tax=Anneissia japonica TaxID=1529436 RepID=UPI00142587B9|nr:carbohydrate sulfotransferase 1-like [Anneissia japonica]